MITKIDEITDSLEIEYLNNNNYYITKKLRKGNRRILNTDRYFTCIELFEEDKIENFLLISEKDFSLNYKNNKNIVLFQYLDYCYSEKTYCSFGKIINACEEEFTYNIQAFDGGIGAPIVFGDYDNNDIYVIGINNEKPTNSDDNKAKNIKYILGKIKEQLRFCKIF